MTERQKQLAVARPFPEEPPNGSHCSWVDMICDVIDSILEICVVRDVYLSIDDPTVSIRGDEKGMTYSCRTFLCLLLLSCKRWAEAGSRRHGKCH